MTYYLGPPLERHERKVGPENCQKAIDEKNDEPLIIPNDLRKLDLSFNKDVNTRQDQTVVDGGIQRASFFYRNTSHVHAKEAEPFGNGSGRKDQEPDERDPKRAGYIGLFPKISPKKEYDESPGKKRC